MSIGDLESNCKKAIEHLKKEAGKLRGGRASSSMLDSVQVEYYGSMVPLIQMGMVNCPEPRLITVQVYDGGAVDAVEKAIRNAELGFNPMREGNLLRIPVPALTNERRKDLSKLLSKLGEETKVSIRQHRREEIDAIKAKLKDKELSEDAAKREEQDVEKIKAKYEAEVETVIEAKSKELLDG